MATETRSAGFGEVRGVGASKGVSLSTTAARTVFPFGTKWIRLKPTTFSTAVVARFALLPWLTVLKTTDSLATAPTDYSEVAQDSSTSTSVVLSSFGEAANGDFLYVGSWMKFGGVVIDVDGANSTTNALTVKYWNGSAWTDISATDGTASGGVSLAQDASVTWTVPAAWVKTSLIDAGDTRASLGIAQHPMFWTRWEWDAANDSATTVDSMTPIEVSTAYAEMSTGENWEQSITVGPGGHIGVSALTDAGTALLQIVAATRAGGYFA
jgi:hypothetical protein